MHQQLQDLGSGQSVNSTNQPKHACDRSLCCVRGPIDGRQHAFRSRHPYNFGTRDQFLGKSVSQPSSLAESDCYLSAWCHVPARPDGFGSRLSNLRVYLSLHSLSLTYL
ncbi:hypothetical protein THAOC_25004 [Thalassiosira oceanica]|uniref:Uncharacterized protein n=1 Tax=Thalassiosira oceanica TaxID=159749 RepID=K0S966_THAOC|nr:hypothetical protein THAOC_25004 [Thalassiosira oceanica]|eukprot:EJK55277.1 hypothetical protein THAOC_25004 [Thalassiosira oceanica]